MIDKSQVLNIVKQRGPVLPRDVVKELGGDTFITGALLSTLVDNKEIKISSAKIGGSPVYYMQGQESKLEVLYKYLHEKERKAYDLLKERKIIRDIEEEPVIRVALRGIKDFAKALEVSVSGTKEIFWRWHLFSNQEAEQAIRSLISKKTELKPEPQKEIVQETEKIPEPEKPQEEKPKEKPKEKPQAQKQEVLETTVKKPEPTDSDLFNKIKKKFEEKGIEIIETNIIRKNSDIEFLVNVPSPVGKLRYFCKARDKKKSNDKDLSSVYVQGQMKKLPVLYATTGELTKKAKDMLNHEFNTLAVMII